MPQVGNVTGLQTRTGWGHGLSWVRVRVPNLNPRKTRTRDTGLTSIMGVASNCYCYITGWSSLVPSISNHILASGDHENEDSKREEQRRQVDNDRGGIAGVPWVIIIITALFTDYTRTAEVREAARRVSTPLSFHYHCTTEQRQSQAPATTGDRQQHTRKEQRRCEEVPTSSQHCSFLFDTARRCTSLCHSSFFLFSTQQGGTHLLVVSLFLFTTTRRYPPLHPSYFWHSEEVPTSSLCRYSCFLLVVFATTRTSVKLQWPFEELITPFLPLVPFFPFHVLLQNFPKAAK